MEKSCRFFSRQVIVLLVCTFGNSYQDQLVKDLRFKTSNGEEIPFVGLGTVYIEGDAVKNVLDTALTSGYRLFDTAKVYGNEKEIGKALKELLPKHNLTRKDIFITSKLAVEDLGDGAYKALENSLKKLDSGYIDLYLIHWPGPVDKNSSNELNSVKRSKSWELLVKGLKDGLVKNIGVSNYNVRHLKELLANDFGIKPAVNQVEWHPHYWQQELKDYCDQEGILLQAYRSLNGPGNADLIKDERVLKIAEKLEKSPAQVLLKWALQQNIAIIPKAKSKKHLDENIDLNFIIPEEDVKILNSFEQKKFTWDPNTIA